MNGTKTMTCPVGYHKIENIHNGKVASGTVKAGGQDKPAPGEYIKWDSDGVEKIPAGETEKIQAVSDQFNRFQMMNFNEHMHCLRGTHLKTQGVGRIIYYLYTQADGEYSVSWASSLFTTNSRLISPKACSQSPARTML
jgi:hypothetical protein